MSIKTTHVGSLPRPADMISKSVRKQEITEPDLRSYVSDILEKQVTLGITHINNGELPRQDYVHSTVSRISGFYDSGTAPIPKDLEELPDYSRRFNNRNGLITLNPKALVTLPACSQPLRYSGEESLRKELDMMVSCFQDIKTTYPDSESELFFTAPSPGTVALFMEDKHFYDYDKYLENIGDVLKKEYEIINSYGISLQIDCPDLAMGRHTKFRKLEENQFLDLIHKNIDVLNHALAGVDQTRSRAHICWGNYPGTHHCDINLDSIFDTIMKIDATYISLESSNHRHGHEWEVFKNKQFPDDKILMPGVIDTTSHTIEHPDLVAQRILNFTRILGKDKVIASTDCGFASTASSTGVSGEIAWLKLKSLVEGARRVE